MYLFCVKSILETNPFGSRKTSQMCHYFTVFIHLCSLGKMMDVQSELCSFFHMSAKRQGILADVLKQSDLVTTKKSKLSSLSQTRWVERCSFQFCRSQVGQTSRSTGYLVKLIQYKIHKNLLNLFYAQKSIAYFLFYIAAVNRSLFGYIC